MYPATHRAMRDVAVVSFSSYATAGGELDETEMLVRVIGDALARAGIPKSDIGFTVSGSSDYLGGRPFSFVMALDAVGAWPPISESHVEMDGAFALYEAWVRLQHGDIDTALVYAFGRATQGSLRDVLAVQLDPYCVAPLWPDETSLAALQARALLDSGRCTERDFAAVVARGSSSSVDELLARPYEVAPLRAHDRVPFMDGASAVVLAAGDRARRACERPAWIRGIDHRIEAHSLGARDLTRSPSTELAARRAGAHGRKVDVAEIHANYAHQELIVRDALSLPSEVRVNPSGSKQDPFMVTGLNRIGEASRSISEGQARSAIAHASSGPCLQQNLVCLLEAS